MKEKMLDGRKISRFTRHVKNRLTAIPTYPTDFFKYPSFETQPVKTEPEETLLSDENISIRPNRGDYYISLITPNRKIARRAHDTLARRSNSGSTSPKHAFFQEFSLSITLEAVTIHGNLDILREITNYLYDELHYISKQKHDELCKAIDEFLGIVDDTESSESDSPRDAKNSVHDILPPHLQEGTITWTMQPK